MVVSSVYRDYLHTSNDTSVIDDILSLIVIAVFYSNHLFLTPLLFVVVLLFLLVLTNLSGFRHPVIYLFFGLLLLFFIQKSGLHGTIAGVLLAMFIPARPKKKPKVALKKIRSLLNNFEETYDKEKHLLEEVKSHQILEGLKHISLEATTPLIRWEHLLKLPVLILILPLFVLTNGGFHVDTNNVSVIFSSQLFWGIFLGLVLAKPLGILITSWVIQKIKLAQRPGDIYFSDMIIIAFVASIGYTMSLFISELAFSSHELTNIAKLSIFISALVSLLIAITIMITKNRWMVLNPSWSKNKLNTESIINK